MELIMINDELKEILELSEEQIAKLSYESAMEKLEVVVDALEQEGTPLEMGLKLYELGTILSRKCGQILDSTEEKMVQLLGTVENPKEENFNPEDDGR
jgi:exodeoxyribonuclease VII small subunit